MKLAELAREDRDTLVMASSLCAVTLTEMALKLFCLRRLLARFRAGDTFSRDELMIEAEDLEVPLPEENVVALVLETGLIEQIEGGRFRVLETVSLTRRYPRELGGEDIDLPIDRYRQMRVMVAQDQWAVVRPGDCVAAIRRTWRWALEVTKYCVHAGLAGVPVFWPCEPSGHRPLISDIGTATTMDTLLLFVQSVRRGVRPQILDDADAVREVSALVDIAMALQRRSAGWDQGAFGAREHDEDFVGTFLPHLAERGSCPTVDGTAHAVRALSLTDAAFRSAGRQSPDSLRNVTELAVEFLLRQQQTPGAWGVYRYEGEAFDMAPREVSSALTVDALALATTRGLLSTTVGPRVLSAIGRYLTWVEERARIRDDEVFWLPDFALGGEEDGFGATLWTARSLLSIGEGWPAERQRIERLIDGALRHVMSHWHPRGQASLPVKFHVPTWEGPAAIEFVWEVPVDALASTLVLDFAMLSGRELTGDAWFNANASVADALAGEMHGHWVDFLMKQEGVNRAVPAITRFCSDTLLAYVQYLSTPHRLAISVGDAPQRD